MSMFIIFFPIFLPIFFFPSFFFFSSLYRYQRKQLKYEYFIEYIYTWNFLKNLFCAMSYVIYIYKTVWWFVAELTAEKFQIVSIFNVNRIARIIFIFFYYFPAPWTRQENDLSQLHESSYIAWYVPMYFSCCTYTYACIRPARVLQFFASNMVRREESI